jgi:hypothetical protein
MSSVVPPDGCLRYVGADGQHRYCWLPAEAAQIVRDLEADARAWRLSMIPQMLETPDAS